MPILKKCISVLPIQFLGPSPKGRYEWFGLLAFTSSLKFSGLKISGSGKYFGSWCSPYIGIKIITPTSRFTDVPGIMYGFVTTRIVAGTGGCFLRVSEINSWQICDHTIIQTEGTQRHCSKSSTRTETGYENQFFFYMAYPLMSLNHKGQCCISHRQQKLMLKGTHLQSQFQWAL